TIRLPPRPTLFPYTTLFRSTPEEATQYPTPISGKLVLIDEGLCVHWASRGGRTVHARLDASGALSMGGEFARRSHADWLPLGWEDRKSTRLNSSHDQISYAV